MRLNRTTILAGVSTAVLLAGTTGAFAQAFGLRTQSTNSLGAAFAGNASGMAGQSSIFWNPATITMRPGRNSEFNFTYVAPDSRIFPTAPTPTVGLGPSGDIGQDAFVPGSFSSYQFNENVWVGIASGSLFGSITKPNPVWAGQTYSRSSRITSLNFAPMVGYKLNEFVSVGAGPVVQYFKVRLNSAAGVGALSPNVILEGDDYDVGLIAGVTVTPFAGTTLGVGYRSSIRHDVEGTLRVPSAVLPPAVVTPVAVNVNLPEQITFGVTQQVTQQFKASFGFEWQNWSRLGIPGIRSQVNGAPVTGLPLRYKDAFLYSVGGEYQLLPELALRAGVAYLATAIDNNNRSTRLPDTDRIYASIGASYKVTEKLTINGAYSHVFGVGDTRIRITPGNPQFNGLPFFADTETSVDVVSVSLGYRWDDPAVAVPAPIIRKF
jgi:long-chain fatty acid transport protein